MIAIPELWHNGSAADWRAALDLYWLHVKPQLRVLEQRMDRLNLEEVGCMDAATWHTFLREEYFPWKYTAANRLATTRASFDRWVVRATVCGSG